MALKTLDRTMESSTTTGTGAFSLAGAYTGYQRFSAGCSVADTVYYCIEALDSNGNPSGDWEVGLGTYSSANTLTRTTVHFSSNSNNAVNFGAGTKRVFGSATATNLGLFAQKANNLSDLASASTARANLGLTTVAATGSAADLTGNLSVNRLNGGTSASSSTYWRGDGTWATPSGGGSWVLTGAGQTATGIWEQTTDGSKSTIRFTGLAGANDIMLVCDSVSQSVAGVPFIRCSIDNGSTYKSASGDYKTSDAGGAFTNSTGSAGLHTSSDTATHSWSVELRGANTIAPPKIIKSLVRDSGGTGWFYNASSVNAISMETSGGGTFNAGKVWCYIR